MAIVAFFSDVASRATYDRATEIIKSDPSWKPEGLRYHVAYEAEGGVKVLEVWDSAAEMEAFAVTLAPLLARAGIDTESDAAPAIHTVVNLEA